MKFPITLSLIIFILFGTAFAKSSSWNSPVGYWQQIDDKTGRPHSIVQIFQKQDIVYGKVIKGYPRLDGTMPPKFCTQCSGELYNQPIIGMTILSGFIQVSKIKWSGGTILDPDNGKYYKAQLVLTDQGKTLKVRGYVGMTLFGRTQTWKRLYGRFFNIPALSSSN